MTEEEHLTTSIGQESTEISVMECENTFEIPKRPHESSLNLATIALTIEGAVILVLSLYPGHSLTPEKIITAVAAAIVCAIALGEVYEDQTIINNRKLLQKNNPQ